MLRVSHIVTIAALIFVPHIVLANTFQDDLDQVDYALKNNPTKALQQSLESCLAQRNHAVVLQKMGQHERARRALDYCFDSLQVKR